MAIELIFTALIIFCALNQKYPVRYFIDYGATKKVSGQFHKTGGALRISGALLGSLAYFYKSGSLINSIAFFFLLLTIAWITFNLVLSIATKGLNRAFFIGTTSRVDKFFTKWFKDLAGQVIFLLSISVIVWLKLGIYSGWIVRAVESVRAWLN